MYICMYIIQNNTKSYIKVILTSYHNIINTNIHIDTLYDEPNISGGNLRRLDFSADFRRVTHLTWSQFVLVRQ